MPCRAPFFWHWVCNLNRLRRLRWAHSPFSAALVNDVVPKTELQLPVAQALTLFVKGRRKDQQAVSWHTKSGHRSFHSRSSRCTNVSSSWWAKCQDRLDAHRDKSRWGTHTGGQWCDKCSARKAARDDRFSGSEQVSHLPFHRTSNPFHGHVRVSLTWKSFNYHFCKTSPNGCFYITFPLKHRIACSKTRSKNVLCVLYSHFDTSIGHHSMRRTTSNTESQM